MDNNILTKVILIDIETTGLDVYEHEILEIGAIEVDTGREFYVKILPEHIETAEERALTINGYSPELWKTAVPLSEALILLTEFAGECKYFMAYNVSFDRVFVQKAYKKCGIEYPFNYHHFDLLTIAWYRLHAGSPLSLKSVCTQLKLEVEPEIHNALDGARAAYRVYNRLTV